MFPYTVLFLSSGTGKHPYRVFPSGGRPSAGLLAFVSIITGIPPFRQGISARGENFFLNFFALSGNALRQKGPPGFHEIPKNKPSVIDKLPEICYDEFVADSGCPKKRKRPVFSAPGHRKTETERRRSYFYDKLVKNRMLLPAPYGLARLSAVSHAASADGNRENKIHPGLRAAAGAAVRR